MVEHPPDPASVLADAGRSARERIADFVVTMSELRAAGDIEGFLAHVTEDIVCHAPGTWAFPQFRVTLRGKAALRQGLRERHIQYIFLPSIVHRVVADGDSAFVHRTTTQRPRGGGEMTSFDVVDLLRFRDGLVCEFTEFPDGGMYGRVGAFPH